MLTLSFLPNNLKWEKPCPSHKVLCQERKARLVLRRSTVLLHPEISEGLLSGPGLVNSTSRVVVGAGDTWCRVKLGRDYFPYTGLDNQALHLLREAREARYSMSL
jgi:hypothetical protein